MTDSLTPVDAPESRRRADELIGWLREYASTRVNSRLMDERRCIPPYIILDFGNRGLLGTTVSEEYGGLGLRHVDNLRVLEQVAAIDLTLALVVFSHNVNGTRPIQRYAKPRVREQFLPLLARGRELAAFALSEPGAGSNLGAIATEAHPDGQGGWRIRGQKRWNNASWAGVISVFARQIDHRGRPGGLTGFVVRQGSPGLRIGPEALTMGLRGSVQNSLFFDDVFADSEHLLGEPGRGMDIAEDALTIGRLCIAAVCLGGIKRCAQLFVRYSERRLVATGPLLDNPLALATLGEMTAWIDALEALIRQVATRLDAGQAVPPELSMVAKVIGSDGLNWAASALMQYLGGRGYMENNLAPQILRDARVYSVGEGPSEPLTIQVGRKARLTDVIDQYLRAGAGGVELADCCKTVAGEVADRCLNRPGPFADRSSAQVWVDAQMGKVIADALLVAALREFARGDAPERIERANLWAEMRLARSIQAAREGSPNERLMPTSAEVATVVSSYTDAIGDVEQTLAGEDNALDPYLRRTTAEDPDAGSAELPGRGRVAEPISNQDAGTPRLAPMN
jgi:alkylation response protein AidB-like acyl-CoA dehydrogenase